MRILVVDDSVADRRLCKLLLEEDAIAVNLEFEEARNAEEGLAYCRAAMPDCVLLDYKLPDMSGLEFLEHLGQGPPTGIPPCAVVMLTGLGSEKIAAEAMKAGAQDYLVKDQITAQGLLLAIDKATEKVRLLKTLAEERDRLADSLAEKEILLKEVHHRVKNNLQVIASLLQLQADSLGDSDAVDALRESQHRVESMALMHEQLYQTKNAHAVEMETQIRDLALGLARAYAAEGRRIRCGVRIEPFALELDRAIPVGLILNELISNAFKHAFPAGRSGALEIAATREKDSMRISVRDDGIGIPSRVETEKGGSLGLQIVRILARQVKATVELVQDAGTACYLTIPLKRESVTRSQERTHEERPQAISQPEERLQSVGGGR
jgi:two-component sensor histidine kinase/CheY-like chemotaxis protein